MLRRLFGRSKPDKPVSDDSKEAAAGAEKSSPTAASPLDSSASEAGASKKVDPAEPERFEADKSVEATLQDSTVKLPLQNPSGNIQREELGIENSLDGKLAAAGKTSVGRQRDHNEDSFFMVTYSPKDAKKYFNFGLYIVADGMGGHLNGEVASQTAVNSISNDLVTQIFDPMVTGKRFSEETEIHDLLNNAAGNAHRSIREQAPGGGTTMTTVLITDNLMTIAHIGDSRAYLIGQDGSSEVLTRDHSFVKKLIELGHITAAEAAVHPQRNVLYRALGQGDTFEPDIATSPLPQKAHLLICSDGLWGVIAENEIIQAINSDSTLAATCDKLIDAANKAGGPDNITAIVVRLPEEN